MDDGGAVDTSAADSSGFRTPSSPYAVRRRSLTPDTPSRRTPDPQHRRPTPRRSTPVTPARATPPPHRSSTNTATRHSPYPQRQRSSPSRSGALSVIVPNAAGAPPSSPPAPARIGRLELTVQVLIKDTVNKHDKSAKKMTPFIASGDSFPDILQQLWDKYSSHVATLAVATDDGGWRTTPPSIDEWHQAMQFRYKKHPIDPERREQWWNNWIVAVRGETVQLLIYRYGQAIVTNTHLGEFQKACIQPREVDRSGAPSEAVLREAIQELQQHWGLTYRAEAMVWRMWAIKITANRDRSTWAALTQEPAPDVIARHLHPANSAVETHLATMNKSAGLALECVDAMLLQFGQLERDFAALSNRFSVLKSSLEARKVTIEGFARNVLPVPANNVHDPTDTMENVNDFEHEE